MNRFSVNMRDLKGKRDFCYGFLTVDRDISKHKCN